MVIKHSRAQVQPLEGKILNSSELFFSRGINSSNLIHVSSKNHHTLIRYAKIPKSAIKNYFNVKLLLIKFFQE